MRLRNLSLRAKICIAPAILVVTLVGLAIYALALLQNSDQRLEQLSSSAFDRSAHVAALDREMAGIQSRLYRLTSLSANGFDPASARAVGAELSVELDRLPRVLKALSDDDTSAQHSALIQTLAKTVSDYAQAVRQVVDTANDSAHAMTFINVVHTVYQNYDDQSQQLTAILKGDKTMLIEELENGTHSARLIFIWTTAAAAAAAVVATFLLGHMIARPVVRMTDTMRRLASGDLTVETGELGRNDEIGAMDNALRIFKDTAAAASRLAAERDRERLNQVARGERLADLTQKFDLQVTGVLDAVASAAAQLQSTATGMASTAEQTSRQSTAATSASALAASNVNTVASATEELAASVTEIGRQVILSTHVADKAVAEAERTNRTVKSLADAARKNRPGGRADQLDRRPDHSPGAQRHDPRSGPCRPEAGKGFMRSWPARSSRSRPRRRRRPRRSRARSPACST